MSNFNVTEHMDSMDRTMMDTPETPDSPLQIPCNEAIRLLYENARLQNAVTTAEQNLSDAQRQIADIQRDKEQLQDEIRTLKRENLTLQENLTHESGAAMLATTTYDLQISGLKSDLLESEEAREEAEKDLKEMSRLWQNLCDDIYKLETQVHIVQAKPLSEEGDGDVAATSSEDVIAALKAEIEFLKASRKSVKASKTEMLQNLKETFIHIDELVKAIDALLEAEKKSASRDTRGEKSRAAATAQERAKAAAARKERQDKQNMLQKLYAEALLKAANDNTKRPTKREIADANGLGDVMPAKKRKTGDVTATDGVTVTVVA